jgi:hypothetical protein
MKPINRTRTNTGAISTLTSLCRASCRGLLAQIRKTKDTILDEFREKLGADRQLLRLALNEAEALAWQTGYPHLVFPTLATEKAQAVATWHARQESIRQGEPALAFAE